MNTFSSIYKYRPLRKYEGLFGKLPCRGGEIFVGVEVELENVIHKSTHIPTSFIEEQDGSLKVHGKEFITVPIRFHYLENELLRLFSGIGKPLISSRCSIHVHLNVRDFTEKELFVFILLYLIFERSLYRLSGDRWNNLFCVPLCLNVGMVREAIKELYDGRGIRDVVWNKYFGLNLCPIWGGEGAKNGALGTVEFRQMGGTVDVEKIIMWVNMITSLKISAKNLSSKHVIQKIEDMNATSEYFLLCDEVFGEFSYLIKDQITFKGDVEGCITKAKLALHSANILKNKGTSVLDFRKE